MPTFRSARSGSIQDEAVVPSAFDRLADPQEDDPVHGRPVIQDIRHQSYLPGMNKIIFLYGADGWLISQ